MTDIKGIIFDYGGTLDTNGTHWFHIFRNTYAPHLPHITEEQLRQAYVHAERYLATHPVIVPTDDFLAMLKKKVALQFTALGIEDAALASTIAHECDSLVRTNMEHTRHVLSTLSARYPLVLVSNFYGNIHTVLRTYSLDTYFREVIESAVVGIRKPDPQIFALGIAALGMHPHEVLVVGDSYSKDIVPAHSLGCRTLWLKGPGWDDTDDSAIAPCAHAVISKLTEIVEANELVC